MKHVLIPIQHLEYNDYRVSNQCFNNRLVYLFEDKYIRHSFEQPARYNSNSI